MARYKKKDYLTTIELLEEINRKLQERGWNQPDVTVALTDCQEAAIALGSNLEQQGEIGVQLTHILEEYCENLYQMGEQLNGGNQENCIQIGEKIESQLAELQEKLEEQWVDKREIVFLPYKASMWDSLESIWMAAEADPECDAYVVPIPYYERNADGSFGSFHYEGEEFPENVPIMSYEDYRIEERRPDVIYIHNPYDQANSVTSIDPRFYSAELKKYTKILVYVPYYATSGGMSEGRALCPVYLYADYIVMQSKWYRKFFHRDIPEHKLLPLGSPKFDRVIRLCKNPPVASEEWRRVMEGKKIYFYNTSLSGMLEDTRRFLQKMKYVFQCFEGRKDCCLLWRPHPLLESTFDSMRKEYRPYYDRLKREFMDKQLGIYDDTPDIEQSIALSDAYIGDSGTSVISLFGIVGKPLFILNNAIDTCPQEDDWRGEVIKGYFVDGQDDWMITQGNKLYCAPNHDYVYEYVCDLSQYSGGEYYLRALQIDDKVYVCPKNAQNILVLVKGKIAKTIQLKDLEERGGAFYAVWNIGIYIFLIPYRYPAIVRYNTQTDKVDYIENGREIFVKKVDGQWRVGGSCVWKNFVLIASPDSNEVLAIESRTMQMSIISINTEFKNNCMRMVSDEDEIWLLPYEGTTIICWNPITGQTKEYNQWPEGFQCTSVPFGYPCKEKPFSGIAFAKEWAIISPYWGNKFFAINKVSGEIKEWKPPFRLSDEEKNGYWFSEYKGVFLRPSEEKDVGTYRFFYNIDRKLYDINIETGDYREIPIVFQKEELRAHEVGFHEVSQWFQYGCLENSFCTLDNFLDGTLCGEPHDREREIAAYSSVSANADGTCGEKIYQTVCHNLESRGQTI